MRSPFQPARAPRCHPAAWGRSCILLAAGALALVLSQGWPGFQRGAGGAGPIPDPFAPGLRWSDGASAQAPWVPSATALTADGSFVWCARAFQTPGLALYPSAPFATGASALRLDSLGPLVGTPLVAAGADASELYALSQHPLGTSGLRSSRLARYDAGSAIFDPIWSDESAPASHAPAVLALAGDTLVRGVLVPADPLLPGSVDRVLIDWFRATDGQLLSSVSTAATGVLDLAPSSDAGRVAVLDVARVFVVDSAGSLHLDAALQTAGRALAISGDGQRLLVGDVAGVRVFEDWPAAGGFVEQATIAGAGPEIPIRAVLDEPGLTSAVAWWNPITGVDVRLTVRDEGAGSTLLEYAQQGSPQGKQNFPVAVRMSADGARIACALWGVSDDRPEALLFDRGSALPLLEIDLPGSPLDLGLDSSGSRIAVAAKDAHANEFSSQGSLYLADTGEADVALRAYPGNVWTAGAGPGASGGLLLASALRPGTKFAIFVVGQGLSEPVTVPGVWGQLWVERATARFHIAPSDAAGRADLSKALPPLPSALDLRVQAVWRIGGNTVLSDSCAPIPLY